MAAAEAAHSKEAAEAAQSSKAATAAQSSHADEAAQPEQANQWTEEENHICLHRQILAENQKQIKIMNRLTGKLADIEKATHFLERRSDVAAGLISDHQRHSTHAKDASERLQDQCLTTKQHARKERALKQARRLQYANRQIALYRGSVFVPCLQPVLQFYADWLSAQVAKDKADQAAEKAADEAANKASREGARRASEAANKASQ